MGLEYEVVMVGDDLVNDVGGAKRCGMRGILVRTGKYRSDEWNLHHTDTRTPSAVMVIDVVTMVHNHNIHVICLQLPWQPRLV